MKIKQNSFVLRFYRIFTHNALQSSSAEMAYYLLFAFFPVIMVVYASFALAGWANPEFVARFTVILPQSIRELIDSFIKHISSDASNLSFLITGIILAMYSVTRFTRSVKAKVRKIYSAASNSSIFMEWITSAVFSALLFAVFYITLFLMILGDHFINLVSNYIVISNVANTLLLVLRYLITVFVALSTLFLFYYIIPNVKQSFSDVIFGTVFTVLGWLAVSFGFTYYMNNFANYSVVYGSIGAFIMLLLWFYLLSLLLLVGAVINSMIYNSRRKIKLGCIVK